MTCSFQSSFKNMMKAVDPLRMIHTHTHMHINLHKFYEKFKEKNHRPPCYIQLEFSKIRHWKGLGYKIFTKDHSCERKEGKAELQGRSQIIIQTSQSLRQPGRDLWKQLLVRVFSVWTKRLGFYTSALLRCRMRAALERVEP